MIVNKEIKEITSNINVPLNVLSLPGLTSCNMLKELGEVRDTSHLYENLARMDVEYDVG